MNMHTRREPMATSTESPFIEEEAEAGMVK